MTPSEDRIKVIARIRSDFPSKFGIPRQSSIADSLISEIVFEPEYRNDAALRGIEGFSHLWLIWKFSESVRAYAETEKAERRRTADINIQRILLLILVAFNNISMLL